MVTAMLWSSVWVILCSVWTILRSVWVVLGRLWGVMRHVWPVLLCGCVRGIPGVLVCGRSAWPGCVKLTLRVEGVRLHLPGQLLFLSL